jgi:hypothetical protein
VRIQVDTDDLPNQNEIFSLFVKPMQVLGIVVVGWAVSLLVIVLAFLLLVFLAR